MKVLPIYHVNGLGTLSAEAHNVLMKAIGLWDLQSRRLQRLLPILSSPVDLPDVGRQQTDQQEIECDVESPIRQSLGLVKQEAQANR